MQHLEMPRLVSLAGLPGRAPEGLLDALLAAWVVGAELLVVELGLTADDRLVAATDATLARMGRPGGVRAATLRDILALDAGAGFRGRFEQGAGVVAGLDEPWRKHGPQPASRVCVPADVLRALAGVVPIVFRLGGEGIDWERAVSALGGELAPFLGEDRLGVAVPAAALGLVRRSCPGATPWLAAAPAEPLPAVLGACHLEGTPAVVDHETLLGAPPPRVRRRPQGAWPRAGELVAVPAPGRTSTPDELARIAAHPQVWGLAPSDPLRAAEGPRRRPALLEDDLCGSALDRRAWVAGYSRENDDTLWHCTDRGFLVDMREGGAYSGAGLVLAWPIRGDFEVDVEFEVDNPMQGTTLELCVINVNPGAHQERPLGGRIEEHPAFDVHGGSPYVGVERDEGDGFRIICSRGSTILTPNRQNVYNYYGRDVGDPAARTGTLRLVRRGEAWAAFYRDPSNPGLMCCGSLINGSMNREVWIRMAAKHWSKAGATPPRNKVWFRRFSIAKRTALLPALAAPP